MQLIDSIGVYWGPRKETARECADRLLKYLQELSRTNPLLATWYVKQRDRKAPKMPVPLDANEIVGIVTAGMNRRDVGGDAMESLGFRVALWNGHDGSQAIGLSIKCGLFEQNPNLGNAAVVTVPSDVASKDDAQALSKQILVRGIEAWEPDWGATFFSGSSALQQRVGNGPFLDRALWIKDRRALEQFDATSTRREPLLDGVLVHRD